MSKRWSFIYGVFVLLVIINTDLAFSQVNGINKYGCVDHHSASGKFKSTDDIELEDIYIPICYQKDTFRLFLGLEFWEILISIQWLKDNDTLVGDTSNPLVITDIDEQDVGIYEAVGKLDSLGYIVDFYTNRAHLFLVYPSYTSQDIMLCPGDSIFINEQFRKDSGIYKDTLFNRWGCDSIVTYDVDFYPEPNPLSLDDVYTCPGDSSYYVLPPGYSSYLWDDGYSLPGRYLKEERTYSVTVTNQNGCKVSGSFDMYFSEEIYVSNDIYICPGDSVLLAGAYRKKEGIYVDTLIRPSCDTIMFTSLSLYPEPHMKLGSDTTICIGDSVKIGVADIYTEYLWSDSSQFNIKTVKDEGVYILSVVDTNGCFAKDTILVSKYASVYGKFEISSESVHCFGGDDGHISVRELNGYNDLTYKWFDGSDGTKVSSLEAGSYGLTVYDNNGCSYDTMIIIDDGRKIQYSKEFNNPYCPEIPDGSIWIKVDESPLLYEYQWSTGGEFNIIENLSQGQYFVTITDKRDDCSVVDTTFLYPDNEICIRIPNAFSPNGDGINETWDIPMLHQLYPNVEVFIFDIWGKVVFISEGYTEPWDGCTEDGYPLPVSTYYYVMELNDGRGSDITGNVLILR